MSFEEAQTAFSDEHALLLDDPDHSEAEDRFILLGLSAALRLLVGRGGPGLPAGPALLEAKRWKR